LVLTLILKSNVMGIEEEIKAEAESTEELEVLDALAKEDQQSTPSFTLQSLTLQLTIQDAEIDRILKAFQLDASALPQFAHIPTSERLTLHQLRRPQPPTRHPRHSNQGPIPHPLPPNPSR